MPSDIAASTPTAYSRDVFTFIESCIFERVLPSYLDDDEYSELQQYLIQNPEAETSFRDPGACARYAGHGRERESEADSASSILFEPKEFWMLTLYAKAKRENIPAHILKQLVKAFRDEEEA